MSSYNRIIMVGNLTRDPDVTFTNSNVSVCKFGIATNHKWKNKDGDEREEVCFLDCTLFGKAGDVFAKYMAKGRSVLLEGRLQLSRWETKDGDKRSRHEMMVESFTFLGSRNEAVPQGDDEDDGAF